ncbi:hypothetical protein N7451_006470 [Penicillium sp. IBT 35674x]|nr:hypothetical protein N7451_006470 [Penicillium sp. IBT 35674x]
MEMDLNSIHRWLSKVPDAQSAGNATDDPNQLGVALADTLPISPNIVDSARKYAEVEDALLVQRQNQSEKAGHELQPNFDRKPRHKTREDRYDYKGAGTIKPHSTSHRDKKKRRISRKHTMNDAFRAPNVARERLTLRGNLNVGIFNKGKASSPIKLGHVPNSAYSERRFLTRKHPGSSSKSPTIEKKRKVGHKPPKNVTGRQQNQPVYIFSELVKELETEGTNTEQLIFQARQRQFDQPNEDPKIDQGLCMGRNSGLGVQREQLEMRSRRSFLTHPVTKTASWSRSDTPYTWSETNPSKLQPELALEIELLKLLHVGLYPAQGDDPARESNQNYTYYNLDELKDILDSRKEYWASEPSQTPQVVAASPIAKVHKTRESPMREDLINSVHPQAKHPDTEELGHDKFIQCAPRQISSRPVSQSHNNEKVSSISQPERLEKMSFDFHGTQSAQENPSDDVFFSNLDAAFWAIVDPKAQNKMDSLVMMGIQQSSPTFDFEDIMTTAERISAEVSKGPSQGLLSHAQVGMETLYPPPPAAHDYLDPKKRVTRPENDHGQGDAMMLQSPQREVSNRMIGQRQPRLQPSITHNSSDDPVPPGFWRQNRLY